MEVKQRAFWEKLVRKEFAETELAFARMLRSAAETPSFGALNGPEALEVIASSLEERAVEALKDAPEGTLSLALGELIAMRDNCRCKS